MNIECKVFKEGDKVITSKGRFGIIKSINDNKAQIQIGNNTFEIDTIELLHKDNAKSIEVEYQEGKLFGSPILKEMLYIPKKLVIYDYNNPMSNTVLDYCKEKLIKRINKPDLLILKLYLV